MKMNKNLAIAMAGAIVAGGVAPLSQVVYANEEKIVTQESININLSAARGETGNSEDDAAEYDKLVKTKKRLFDMSKATYTEKDPVTGEAVVKRQYMFTDTKGNNLEADRVNPDEYVKVEDGKYTLEIVDMKLGITILSVAFEGILDLDPGFGQPDWRPEVQFVSVDMKTTSGKSKLENIKKELKANRDEITYNVRMMEANTSDQTADYKIVVGYKINGFQVAEIIVKNAPLSLIGEDGNVILPENSDFKNHWAKEYIENAIIDGWIVNDANFRPEDNITRAEFVRVINQAYDIQHQGKPSQTFDDIKGNEWYAEDIAKAVEKGYIKGYETTHVDANGVVTKSKEFRPNQPITREEAAVIVGYFENGEKHMDTLDGNGNHTVYNTKFQDTNKIGIWADEAVAKLSEKEVINGYEDGTFKPQNKITRAESVVMIAGAATK